MTEIIIPIPARLKNVAQGGHVAGSEDIDAGGNKNQKQVNDDVNLGIQIINDKIGTMSGNKTINERLDDLEAMEEIVIDGGEAQIAQGSDFTNPDAAKRAKIPTVGAIVDGLNDGVYDVSKRNPTSGPNSDGKFTLGYILDNANTLIPTGWRHGGMTISFVDSSDNKYVQARCMAQNFTTDVTQWQGVDDEPTSGSDNLVKSGGTFALKQLVYSSFSNTNSLAATYKVENDKVVEESTNYNYRQIIINCSEGDEFVIYGNSSSSHPLCVFTDSSNNVIEKYGDDDFSEQGLYAKAPTNTSKVVLSCYYNYKEKWVIFKNGVISKIFKDVKNSQEDIINIQTEVTKIESDIKTLSDVHTYLTLLPVLNTAGFIQKSDGKFVEYSGYVSTDFVKIEDFEVYHYRGSIIYNVAAVACYSNNNEDSFIASIPTSGSSLVTYEKTFEISDFPVGTKYIRFSARNYADTDFVIPYFAKGSVNNTIFQEKKKLFDKKMYFIGDSIMMGQDNKESVKSVTYYLSSKFGLNIVNNSQGGAVLTSSNKKTPSLRIYKQLTDIPVNADYIIMSGGVNGINKTATEDAPWGWGEISDSFTTNFDTVLQLPCLEAMCKYVVTHWPNKKYGFIITYDISEYDYWEEKATLIKQVLDKWGIPYLDWRHSGINLGSPDIREKYGIDAATIYPAYSNTATYQTDDRVFRDNKIYKANQDILTPEEFTPAHWDLVSSTRYDGWHCNAVAYEQLADKTIEWLRSL